MTDKQTLVAYRLKQAEETLADAEEMLKNRLSSRSIINRSYYTFFYAVLALFVHEDINPKTSKHAGVISIFDREFVHRGDIPKQYSKMLHRMFEARQEADYKELVEITHEDAEASVEMAREFLAEIGRFINT